MVRIGSTLVLADFAPDPAKGRMRHVDLYHFVRQSGDAAPEPFPLDRWAGYDMALARNEIAFAFGVARPAFHGQHPLLDAVAEMATSLLSVSLGRKVAAKAVRENWELIQQAVEDTEDDARWYAKAGIPSNEHVFLAVCAESDGRWV